ncbi:MAG: Sec-dependent nitrous-oxide reductase [Chloroflexi bacterium]|nr:Sec-dependent nitrous-oxide reductase [Chloroflexota bacterium]
MRGLNGRAALVAIAVAALIGGTILGRVTSGLGGGGLGEIAASRGLTADEAAGALKSFVAPGKYDEYVLLASGGHSGQVHFVGIPSLRLLKTVPVFTPESWAGYGQKADSGEAVLRGGSSTAKNNEQLTWGDTHHPALSETNGTYDGRWAYINDRANGRLAMIDLRDFKTKQIIDLPNMGTSHGGVFATPNTEYVHVSSMQPVPQTPNGYAPLEQYAEHFRGMSAWIAIDPATGRGDVARSFQIELPPYTQDLGDVGKKASAGFGFINSYNTEMSVGTADREGKPLEVGAAKNDYDFLHIIDWQKAQTVAATAGKTVLRNGMRVITLQTAIDDGLLYFAPEPRSPHGVDVSPDGNYIVVGGKLDPHATIYDIDMIKKAIADRNFSGRDRFGVPILKFEAVVAAQVELGAGPLHTQFDNKGNAFTSLFLESAVAKFTLGPKAGVAAGNAFKLVDKVDAHYNIGHLATTEGDTVSADGKYLVALNKWSIDRYPTLGTLKPQNMQLIDLSGEKMKVVAEAPVGYGEPHYAQIIKLDRLAKSLQVYPVGTDPLTFRPSTHATALGRQRIERSGTTVDVYMTVMRSHFAPDVVRVKKGDTVRFHLTSVETTADATHGFAIPGYNAQVSLDPGEVVSIEIKANTVGTFSFYCTEFCSALHLEMQGWLLVEP